MPEPTLSEITNMAVDSERGTGTPAVVYDNRQTVQLLNNAAQFKAENDWRKYNMFLGNLKDLYKDIGEISKQPVMQEDMPGLRKEMGDIINEIGKNPQGFFGGGAKFNDIQGKIAQLQSKATESKGNNLFNEAHRQAILRNPEWESATNKSKINGFGKQPLGTRKLYQFDLPGLLDMDALAKTINNAVVQEKPYSGLSEDNQLILSGSDVTYDPEKFADIAAQAYEQTDGRNIPIRKTYEERFRQLPAYLQEDVIKKYGSEQDPLKSFFVDQMKERMLKNTRKEDPSRPNPGYLEREKMNVDKFRAQSGRISANASALRAQKYAELSNKKLKELGEEEKRARGFWDSVVDRVRGGIAVRQTKGGERVAGDYIFSGDLPKGYRLMGGVGADGKPIELEPLKTHDGTEYYRTQYSLTDGSKVDKSFINNKYKAYTGAGGGGSYDDYVKRLIKTGVIDMEVIGNVRQLVPVFKKDGITPELDDNDKHKMVIKMIPSVANFETAAQAAKSLNNKINTEGEEPIFDEYQQPD